MQANHTGLQLASWQSHLRIGGRAPRTLAEIARAQADYEHRRRVAEIRAMAPRLAKLDELMPAIQAKGVELHTREITSYDRGKTLCVRRPIMSYDDKLHAALLELGFVEVERREWSGEIDVTLRHGRSLRVKVSIKRPQVAS